MCPDCFDAFLFQVDMTEISLKKMKLLDEGLFRRIRLGIFMKFLKLDLILKDYLLK